jgi:hypothetical protein
MYSIGKIPENVKENPEKALFFGDFYGKNSEK